MFDESIFQKCLAKYKKDFVMRFSDERYKWEAIKWFNDHWDINADDFSQMFAKATENTYTLLVSVNNFPRRMIIRFAEKDPEYVRSMFTRLFDENIDVIERINTFQADAQILCDRFYKGKQHYQRSMAITVYLWLRYPDNYSIYKYSALKAATTYLKNDFVPKKGILDKNINGNNEIIHNIQTIIRKDTELMDIFTHAIDENCYPDPNLRTLAHDIIIYISRFFGGSEENYTIDNNDTPDINTALRPKTVIVEEDDLIKYICPRCDYEFKVSKRCPDCGQLIKENE